MQQEAAAHQEFLDLGTEASAAEGVRPAHEAFDELRARYGIPR